MQKLIRIAAAVAKEGEGVGRNDNYRLASVLFDRRQRVLVAKCNSRKTHPRALRFFNYPYLHAEAHSIFSAGLDNCRGHSLLVVRVEANGRLTMAKPCECCTELIKHVGIRNVFYTDWSGNIIRN
jgi:tRNA(Arg) A34 adenosine deaminase TadA